MTLYRLKLDTRVPRLSRSQINIAQPPATRVEFGRRVRRVWAELTRAHQAGEPMPSMRLLARRCRLPSSSTAQSCFEVLVAMGAVNVLARADEADERGIRARIVGAYRLVKPYGWEWYE